MSFFKRIRLFVLLFGLYTTGIIQRRMNDLTAAIFRRIALIDIQAFVTAWNFRYPMLPITSIRPVDGLAPPIPTIDSSPTDFRN